MWKLEKKKEDNLKKEAEKEKEKNQYKINCNSTEFYGNTTTCRICKELTAD